MVVLGNTLTEMTVHADQPTNTFFVDEQDHYNETWVPPFEPREEVRIRTSESFSDYYELHEEIGEGKFGNVYRCVEKSTKLTLAAKCIRLKKDADLQKVEKEINIMTRMRHKCIAQIYDAFATPTNNVILVMEIVEGGELFLRVSEEQYILTEMAVAMIIYQLCQAIQYIHSQSIIHLDLKPENIMCVDKETSNQIKLIDFGLAQYYDGQRDLLFMAGTPEFAAPEVIKYEPLDFHTDMWSVGVITYILLSGESPFLGDNVAITYCNVERGEWEFCEEFDNNRISAEARDFISKLLIVDKSKRMLAHECLQHPWIVGCRERARSSSPYAKPLDTTKLRSYVRNKRFRRAVFGVLFINSVLRTMVRTLREHKSKDGLAYVEHMLQAAGNQRGKEDLVESILHSTHRQLSPQPSTSVSMDEEGLHHEGGGVPVVRTTKKVRRVLRKKPRTQEGEPHGPPPTSATSAAAQRSMSTVVDGCQKQEEQPLLTASLRRRIEKAKRSKSATRKSSSNEQQRRPKKPKASTPSSSSGSTEARRKGAAEPPNLATTHASSVPFQLAVAGSIPGAHSALSLATSERDFSQQQVQKVASFDGHALSSMHPTTPAGDENEGGERQHRQIQSNGSVPRIGVGLLKAKENPSHTGGDGSGAPQSQLTGKKTKVVRVLRKKAIHRYDQIDAGAQSGADKLGSEKATTLSADMSDSSSTQDAFDFRLLRLKLQNRITGLKDAKDLATEEANKLKCAERLQLNCTTENVRTTMRKWISMDKQNADRPLTFD